MKTLLLSLCLFALPLLAQNATPATRDVSVKTMQVVKNGVLATVIGDDGEQPRLAGAIIFIYTKPGAVDGDEFQPTLFPVGTMQYTTVTGAVSTIRTFALNRADAVRFAAQ